MSDTSKHNCSNLISGLLVAAGIALAGYFISQTLYNAKVALNTAEAKGLAEKRVKADRANWSIVFSNAGKSKQDIPELYTQAERQQTMITELLKQNGFDESEINVGVLDYLIREFRDKDGKLVDQKHTLVGSINIETSKVEIVAKARANINKLIAQGIDIQNNAPTYRFTGLNEIKPQMLKDATTNARIAANEFAENAGVKVGGIRSARQGNFFVRDAGEEYGDTKKIEKDVRVVTTITFYLVE